MTSRSTRRTSPMDHCYRRSRRCGKSPAPSGRVGAAMRASRSLPWAVRVAWAALPFTVGPSVAAALHACAPATRDVGSAGAWGLWALALVATLVPHPVSLTALRVAAPGALVCAFVGQVTVLSVAGAMAAVALAFLPETAMWFVNGPAYPNERRFPLRA